MHQVKRIKYAIYDCIARSGGTGYRYDYQGAYAEKDPVTSFSNFDLRMYDSRIGRWLSIDPMGQYASPYEGMGNNPVNSSDPTGGEDGPDGPGTKLPIDSKSGLPSVAYTGPDINITSTRLNFTQVFQMKYDNGTLNDWSGEAAFIQRQAAQWREQYARIHKGEYEANQRAARNLLFFAATDGAGEIIGPFIGPAAARLFGTGAKVATETVTSTGTDVIETEIEEQMVSVFHKGNLQNGIVSSTRALSTGVDRTAVEALERSGSVFEFKIPSST